MRKAECERTMRDGYHSSSRCARRREALGCFKIRIKETKRSRTFLNSMAAGRPRSFNSPLQGSICANLFRRTRLMSRRKLYSPRARSNVLDSLIFCCVARYLDSARIRDKALWLARQRCWPKNSRGRLSARVQRSAFIKITSSPLKRSAALPDCSGLR